jgi:hypothetical protein
MGTDDNREGAPDQLSEDMREEPADVPPVVPAIAIEQTAVAAGIGAAGLAKQNPEGGLTGDEDTAWKRDADDERSEPA